MPNREIVQDVTSDPAPETGANWAQEGGATDDGPATATTSPQTDTPDIDDATADEDGA